MVARYNAIEWQARVDQAKENENALWDFAEATSDAAGYDYNDRWGKRRHPNPKRQQGLVELAMQIYTDGVGWLGWADVG